MIGNWEFREPNVPGPVFRLTISSYDVELPEKGDVKVAKERELV